MGKLAVTTNVTLDGVMQAPGTPKEDTRDGFAHGGWAAPYNDPAMAEKVGQGMGATAALLFGRRTYEGFYDSWANRCALKRSSLLVPDECRKTLRR